MFSDTQSCLTLCDPMDCSPPGFSVQGISQVRILIWVAVSSSRASSWPRDQTHVSCTGRQILYLWATWEAGVVVIKFRHALVWSLSRLHFQVTDLNDIIPQSLGLQDFCWKLYSSIRIPCMWFSLTAFTILSDFDFWEIGYNVS